MIRKRVLAGVLILALVGAGLAAYLTAHYYQVLKGTNIIGGPCTSLGIFDCSAAAFSRAGQLFGLPIALYGLLLYLVLAACALVGLGGSGAMRRPAGAAAWWMVSGMVLYDLYLAAVMFFQIKTVCPFCVGTYAVNLALLVLLSLALKPVRPGALFKEALRLVPVGARPEEGAALEWLMAGFIVVVMGVGLSGGVLARNMATGDEEEIRAYVTHVLSRQRPVLITTAGDPRKGPQDAPITVVKFSDFECKSCQRASHYLRTAMARYPDTVALVYKNFPLDSDCNPFAGGRTHLKACRFALWAECAHRQNRFWDYHDLVFERGTDYPLKKLEEDLGDLGLDVAALKACAKGHEARTALKEDVEAAGRQGVQRTPTFFINGYRFSGDMPPWTLEIVFNEVLKRKGAGG